MLLTAVDFMVQKWPQLDFEALVEALEKQGEAQT